MKAGQTRFGKTTERRPRPAQSREIRRPTTVSHFAKCDTVPRRGRLEATGRPDARPSCRRRRESLRRCSALIAHRYSGDRWPRNRRPAVAATTLTLRPLTSAARASSSPTFYRAALRFFIRGVERRPRDGRLAPMTADRFPPRQTGRADFPHPALAKGVGQRLSQVDQPHSMEMLVKAHPFGRPASALAPPLRVARKTRAHRSADMPAGHSRAAHRNGDAGRRRKMRRNTVGKIHPPTRPRVEPG